MVIVVILEIIMITYVVDMKETVGEVYSAAITGIVVVLGVTWITQFHNQIMNIDSYNAEIDKEIYVLGEKFYLKGLLESDNREYYEENILEKLNRIELNNNKKR